MTTELLLPERLARQKNQKPFGKKKVTEPKVESETAKLPTPTGWRILVMPYVPPKVSKGGIEIPDEVHERERVATNVGLVMAVGPLAYKDINKFGGSKAGSQPKAWCKEKDWILFGKYAGSRFGIDVGELRLLNDDEVLAVIDDPSHIVHT